VAFGPKWGYSVRGVYDMLTSHEHPRLHHNLELIWHRQVPLKVSIFAWRLLCERLPTKSNLAVHGIIPTEARMCVASCGHVEDTTHLFLSCSTFGAIWPLVWRGLVLMGRTHRFFQITFCNLLIIQVV